MKSNIGLHNCSNLIGRLEALGATIPESITETLAVGQTIKKIATTQPGDGIDAIITQGSADGIVDALRTFASERAVHEAVGDRYGQWERALVKRFLRDLDSDVGDAMFAEIRPTFDAAAAAVAQSLELFGPDTGPEHVVEMDAKAIPVWQSLRKHSHTLENYYAIATDMDLHFGALGETTHLRPDSPPLAFVIAEPERPLDDIVRAFKAPAGRNPAGRWARLATVTKLEFRTPSQARTTIERLETEAAEVELRSVHENHRTLKEVS